MSIFSSILEKLGIHKPAAPAAPIAPVAPAAPAAPAVHTTTYEPGFSGSYGAPAPAAPAVPAAPAMPSAPSHYDPLSSITPPIVPAAPVEMPTVDVMGHLENLAKANPVKGLNWKQSINDLMFLLGLPHTPDDIKQLAVELGCPEKEMADSYSRNVWTYQALMKKIAENGGNVPPELMK